jgi:predicted P-loop ATPase
VASIVRDCRTPAGSCAEAYLRNRGITSASLPACICYRPNAHGRYGALVALATDTAGAVTAVQQVYVTSDGRKAPVAVQKRTNKAHDDWSDTSAVRLPGQPPLILCEGVETALSLWQATGNETWACLGLGNIARAPVPEGATVIVARDGDRPGTKADTTLRQVVRSLRKRGCKVSVAAPPTDKDFNDVLIEGGDRTVRAILDAAIDADVASTDWRAGLLCTDEGDPRAVLANAVHALRHAPEWHGVLWRDAFATRTVARQSPPWVADAQDWQEETWTDVNDSLTATWLQQHGIMVPRSIAGEAVETVAHDRSFHPVREYLGGLAWDGVPRIEQWITTYCHGKDSAYVRAVGSRWLLSAVARIYEPGCKADCVLIFEGDQGARKSQAFSALARPWFSDRLSDLGSKDAALECAGVWIIEIAELDSLSRAEASAIKAFMSRTHDRFRPPYGKRVIELPRQCVFAGTLNPEGGYLKDPTGGRRFWPVKTGNAIDVDALKRDRDQLWAEAVHHYRHGRPWWLESKDLEALAKEEQYDRRQPDDWEQPIREYLENEIEWIDFGSYRKKILRPRPKPLEQVKPHEILEHAIEKKVERWTNTDSNRIRRALTAMGWVEDRPRQPDGNRPRVWVPRQTDA